MPLAPVSCFAAAALLLVSTSTASIPPGSPRQAADEFCQLYQHSLLDKQYTRVLSTSLAGKVRHAFEQERRYQQRNPAEPPRLASGLPVTSLPGRATCRVGKIRHTASRISIDVSYLVDDRIEERTMLEMTEERGAWRIDDIRYLSGDMDGTLRRKLDGLFPRTGTH